MNELLTFPASLKAIRKILLVGPAWIGDMMMAQSLMMVLKQRNPDVVIDVLASAWTRQLLSAMPQVNDVIDMPLGHGALGLGERRRLGIALRERQYDQAILLPNSFKSALIPFFARIPLRTGWRGEMRYGVVNDCRSLDKARYPLMVQRYLALALPKDASPIGDYPLPSLCIDTEKSADTLRRFGLHQHRPVMILCPGAEYGASKRWPEHYFAEVADQQIQKGWQVWMLGSAKDGDVTKDIVQLLPDTQREHCVNLAGKTQLGEAVELLSQAQAVISNDSGLMHVAAALGRPLVAIYGSTSPDHTPPLGKQVTVVQEPIDCSPCFKRDCPLGHHKCLRDLHPEKVMSALTQLLATSQT